MSNINPATHLPYDYTPGFVCHLGTCNITEWGAIHYQPTMAGNVLFLVIIDFLGLAQLILGAWHETGFMCLAMLFGLASESTGYIARILLHFDPFSRAYFLWYLICLTIGPAFVAAAIYLSLGRIVVAYGEQISRIKPRTYTVFFLGCDFVALSVQTIGGAIAASAVVTDITMIQLGTHILVAGLSFQVASLFFFMVCTVDFLWRVHKHPEQRNTEFSDLWTSTKFKWYLRAILFATLTLFIRTVFRSVELSQGFGGSLANNEVEFMILDGVMVISACIALTVAHPFYTFGKRWRDTNFPFFNRKPGAGGDQERRPRDARERADEILAAAAAKAEAEKAAGSDSGEKTAANASSRETEIPEVKE